MQDAHPNPDPDENEPYRVEIAPGSCHVVDAAGAVIVVCGHEANASQYAVLLTQAYRRGYKAGYRKGRSS